MTTPAAIQAAVNVLEFHLTDATYNQGCALRCGYHGDEMAVHLAEHVLAAAEPHMKAQAQLPQIPIAKENP